jgi:rhodanese-related sulfurtransferase
LSGGLAAWKKNGLATDAAERIPRLAVPGISSAVLRGYTEQKRAMLIVDIRPDWAVKAKPIPGAMNIPLTQLHERYGEIPLDRPVVVVDEDGSQTLLAASFLLRKGVPVTARLPGGINDLSADKTEGGKSR